MEHGDHLFTTAAGIRSYLDDRGGELVISSFQDVDPILDLNAAMRSHNDGYSPSREMRRVGSIPMSLIFLWKTVEGWDPMHPGNADKLAKKLNDGDYLKLRTADGRL